MMMTKSLKALSLFLCCTTPLAARPAAQINGGNDLGLDPAEEVVGGALLDVVEDVMGATKDVAEGVGSYIKGKVHRTFLAGNFIPFFEKFLLTPDDFRRIGITLHQVADWQDVLFLLTLAYATVPLVSLPYKSFNKASEKDFRMSSYHLVADHFQQFSKIALVVYLTDLAKVILLEIGFAASFIAQMPKIVATVFYTAWIVRKASQIKKWLLCRMWGTSPEMLGRLDVVDHLADAFLLVVAILFVTEMLSVELGLAGKSIFAFGSIGTLVFSLGAQGLVSNFLNGLLLAASDRVYEGDVVEFGNGIQGTVVDMGWMETVLRSDEILLSVPNSDLASQRLSNISRLRKCQVNQTLRFRYQDVKKLPQLCEDIKEEITRACPYLIKDGSRPFRAHWTGYEEGCLTVFVEAHFTIRPIGEGYWTNRQNMLQAIHRAVEKNDMEYA
jgi:small-conductance mechanosensitive channel